MGKAKKKKRYTVKTKRRMFVIFLLFGIVIFGLCYRLLSGFCQINKIKKEKKELEDLLVSLEEEKKILETDIEKLSDPDYIAKYVREKYNYSKDGELILRIDE